MQSFLSNVVDDLDPQKGAILIAPNRRALMFMRKHLSATLGEKPRGFLFLTIEEFITRMTSVRMALKVELIPILHKSFRQVSGRMADASALDQLVDFYFWGDMLLKDFELIDHYCANADVLFTNLSSVKDLDTQFDYLTEDQIKFLENFWDSFGRKHGQHKEQFLELWGKLADVYKHFRKTLSEGGIGYAGMVYREVADNLENGELADQAAAIAKRPVHFVGFNALTKTEERIISYFVAHHRARIHWDVDAFYLQNNQQEAGVFFREYMKHPVLGGTFPEAAPTQLTKKTIHVIGSPTLVSQVKAMANMVKMVDQANDHSLIVLPDEKMFEPVMHSVAPLADHINVTMGYPLSNTPLASLVELFFETHLSINSEGFYHKPLIALLSHPYVSTHYGQVALDLRNQIIEKNWTRVPVTHLASIEEMAILLSQVPAAHLPVKINAFMDVLIGSSAISDLDKDFMLYFQGFLQKLEPVLAELQAHEDEILPGTAKSFLKLFRQLLNSERVPFEGDPLVGLQVMGVLETRNLDFENVFILSMNEGIFPQAITGGSYIPYGIRKAYGLPTHEHREAMYAYLFYRLLQRSENIYLFYSTSKDVLGQGEMSRFLLQLQHESDLNIRWYTHQHDAEITPTAPVVVNKTSAMLERIQSLGSDKGFTPSALNTYLECGLKFFYRYVSGIREADFIEEDLDARVLGDLLHRCMEFMYRSVTSSSDRTITASKIESLRSRIDEFIDKSFRERFSIDTTVAVEYTGQRFVVKEMLQQFILAILNADEQYAPFTMEGIELRGLTHQVAVQGHQFKVTGILDRMDRKGDTVRIVDYKTGKDELKFSTVEDLFVPSSTRNKAAFQTLLYALLSIKSGKTKPRDLVHSGLFNRKNLFEDSFSFGLTRQGRPLGDVTELVEEFDLRLKELVGNIYDVKVPFTQTNYKEACEHCEFKRICRLS